MPRNKRCKDKTNAKTQQRSLQLCIRVITGYCPIKAITTNWESNKTDYWRLCSETEELETIENVLIYSLCIKVKECNSWRIVFLEILKATPQFRQRL